MSGKKNRVRDIERALPRDRLYDMYVTKGLTMAQISKETGLGVGSVFNLVKRYGIESRKNGEWQFGKIVSEETRKKISERTKGKVVSESTRKKMSQSLKKGGIGHKKLRFDGYIYIYFPDHPRSSADGYIMEHILVMEALIGRHLSEDECVHHINEDRKDNRKENLQLMTKSEHMRYHMLKRHANRRQKIE